MEQLCSSLEAAGISVKGMFMNAGAGFDVVELRRVCADKEIEANIAINRRNHKVPLERYEPFDEALYKKRYVVERTDAWLDGFKGLLVRYEKKIKSWMAQHFMAFAVLLLRKVQPC